MIHPDLYQEITRLSDLLRSKFSPPEFIPGCQVKSVTDISLYASNNGWIEAICGQHNQQRVRWKSTETVAVNDYVDVLYFPDRRLFEAYGIGGASAIASADIPKAIIDAKGDLIAGSAADTAARLAVSTNGFVLTADSAEATGLKWAAAASGGGDAPNPFINGALQFWQRGTSFAAIASGSYSADRFVYAAVGAMVHTASQSADVPTVAQADALIPYSLLLDCTTVDSSIAASDFCIVQHLIEGNFASSILQRQFTLSFWVKGTKTGIHCVSFRNQVSDRSYVAEYTINTTATWEYKTITVSASPTAGTWNYTTGTGLSISWSLACGSTYQTTAGTWQTGNFIATSGQVNATDSTANDFRITGIKIEPGAAATPFVLPDYEQELSRCHRYYQKSYAIETNPGTNTTVGPSFLWSTTTSAAWTNTNFKVRMRVSPTLTVYSVVGTINKISTTASVDVTLTTPSFVYQSESGITLVQDSGGTPLTASTGYLFHWVANAEL